jgi:alpha-amylase
MVDEWLGIRIDLRFEPDVLLWRFPVETVSNSESGFERVYQGSAIVPVWLLDLKEGEAAGFGIRIEVSPVGKR